MVPAAPGPILPIRRGGRGGSDALALSPDDDDDHGKQQDDQNGSRQLHMSYEPRSGESCERSESCEARSAESREPRSGES
jgi:hypothetical protein